MTHGIRRWLDGLDLFANDREEALTPGGGSSDARRRLFEADLRSARDLRAVVGHLSQRLEPLLARYAGQELRTRYRVGVDSPVWHD